MGPNSSVISDVELRTKYSVVHASFVWEAYANAKKQGLKEFLFNDRPIAVVDSPNPKYTKREYETTILNLRKVLDQNKKKYQIQQG